MSKKMLKRSLALGALMAFVITGSAMAAETKNYVDETLTWPRSLGIEVDLTKDSTISDYTTNVQNCVAESGKISTIYGVDVDLKQHNATVENSKFIIVDSDLIDARLYGVSVSEYSANNEPVNSVTVTDTEMKITNSTTYNNIYGVNVGSSGKFNAEVKDTDLTIEESIVKSSYIGGISSTGTTNIGLTVTGTNLVLKNSEIVQKETVTYPTPSRIFGVQAFNKGSVVTNNSVTIEGGKVNANVWAVQVGDTSGNNGTYEKNTVKIIGTKENPLTMVSDVFGIASSSGKIYDVGKDNLIDIKLEGTGSSLTGSVHGTASGKTKANVELIDGATWTVTGASTVNTATFGAGSVLKIDGDTFKESTGKYALNGDGTGTLTIVEGAKLTVDGIQEKVIYNIANNYSNLEEAKDKWEITDLNTLMKGQWTTNTGLQLEVVAKDAEQMATEMGVSTSTAQSVADVTTAAQAAKDGGVKADANGIGDAKAVAFVEAMSGVDSKVAGNAYEAVSKMAEAGGNSATAARVVNNVTGVTNDRLSFNCGHSAPHKGGHGVGLFEEGSGADVWVEYVHGKDKVEDMPSTAGATSYEGQYNGIVMGVDFKKVNKFQSGFAFNYGEGDTNSVGSAARTHSDYDFWGIGYYGSIHNDDSNVIFDIGYAKTDSDVETKALGMTYNASPETTTWTAGVKVEKLYQNENVQIVPYTGLRFMSIDPEDYTTECASSKYQMERQNVWLLPLGVSIKQEVTNDNGWTVSPRVDLSYIWAFGDTDSEMEFSTLGTKTNIGYEVMDDGSFLGLVGIEAHKGQWGFGVSYSYQKGDHSESKKWFVDVNYSF